MMRRCRCVAPPCCGDNPRVRRRIASLECAHERHSRVPRRTHGPDLTELRAEIDELASQSTEELVSPAPKIVDENEPTPAPTDPIGSEDWDDTEPA